MATEPRLCFALLCFALLCFALLCFALLCFASGLRCGQAPHPALQAHPLQHVVGWGVCTWYVGVKTRMGCTPPRGQVEAQFANHITMSAPRLLLRVPHSETSLTCLTLPVARTEASAPQAPPRPSTQPFTSTLGGVPSKPASNHDKASYKQYQTEGYTKLFGQLVPLRL